MKVLEEQRKRVAVGGESADATRRALDALQVHMQARDQKDGRGHVRKCATLLA
jgi:hypothetical protein